MSGLLSTLNSSPSQRHLGDGEVDCLCNEIRKNLKLAKDVANGLPHKVTSSQIGSVAEQLHIILVRVQELKNEYRTSAPNNDDIANRKLNNITQQETKLRILIKSKTDKIIKLIRKANDALQHCTDREERGDYTIIPLPSNNEVIQRIESETKTFRSLQQHRKTIKTLKSDIVTEVFQLTQDVKAHLTTLESGYIEPTMKQLRFLQDLKMLSRTNTDAVCAFLRVEKYILKSFFQQICCCPQLHCEFDMNIGCDDSHKVNQVMQFVAEKEYSNVVLIDITNRARDQWFMPEGHCYGAGLGHITYATDCMLYYVLESEMANIAMPGPKLPATLDNFQPPN